jgi:hypothetical protein
MSVILQKNSFRATNTYTQCLTVLALVLNFYKVIYMTLIAELKKKVIVTLNSEQRE